jgi:hypothetical protein
MLFFSPLVFDCLARSEIDAGLDEGPVQLGLVSEASGRVIELHVAPADVRPEPPSELKFRAALHLPGEVGSSAEAADITLSVKRNWFPDVHFACESDHGIHPVYGAGDFQIRRNP